MAINEKTDGKDSVAIMATATGEGAIGMLSKGDAVGIRGDGRTWHGVVGFSEQGFGVYGEGLAGGSGVVGKSSAWHAVAGFSDSKNGGFGVYGEAVGTGVGGVSKTWNGVYGETAGMENGPAGVWGEHKGAGIGVKAISKDGTGLAAYSTSYEAVHAETRSPATAAIAAYNNNPHGTGAALFAKKEGDAGHAGFFSGNVHITGNVTCDKDICCTGADFAEDFNVTEEVEAEPGTVMVLGEEDFLQVSTMAYDKRVAGIISGAGTYRPGIVLDKQLTDQLRKPIALVGKVFCKADAQYGAIETGDLLTTSPTAGYAMKASDPLKAIGAVIGKALKPLASGKGFIPVLVSLQ